MKSTKELAYAKINLFLDIDCKRDDGFHNIKSIMHSLSLCDELTVELSKSNTKNISLEIIGEQSLATDNTNLVVKAANSYLDKINESAALKFSLKKNIPISAGLAGGSSDAAAALRALNRLFDGRLSKSELLLLASSLGSDVPYCLVGGNMLCSGRGELMTEIDGRAEGIFVVAIGEDRVLTSAAYGELDRLYSNFILKNSSSETRLNEIMKFLKKGKFSPEHFYNIFEEAVMPVCPAVKKIKDKMTSLGAIGTLMSGSGPSVFGLFDSEYTAQMAKKRLEVNGYKAFVCKSV